MVVKKKRYILSDPANRENWLMVLVEHGTLLLQTGTLPDHLTEPLFQILDVLRNGSQPMPADVFLQIEPLALQLAPRFIRNTDYLITSMFKAIQPLLQSANSPPILSDPLTLIPSSTNPFLSTTPPKRKERVANASVSPFPSISPAKRTRSALAVTKNQSSSILQQAIFPEPSLLEFFHKHSSFRVCASTFATTEVEDSSCLEVMFESHAKQLVLYRQSFVKEAKTLESFEIRKIYAHLLEACIMVQTKFNDFWTDSHETLCIPVLTLCLYSIFELDSGFEEMRTRFEQTWQRYGANGAIDLESIVNDKGFTELCDIQDMEIKNVDEMCFILNRISHHLSNKPSPGFYQDLKQKIDQGQVFKDLLELDTAYLRQKVSNVGYQLCSDVFIITLANCHWYIALWNFQLACHYMRCICLQKQRSETSKSRNLGTQALELFKHIQSLCTQIHLDTKQFC